MVNPAQRKISLSEQSDNREIQQLERINAELEASLKNCRAILRDCQARLAANSNEPEASQESDVGARHDQSEA